MERKVALLLDADSDFHDRRLVEVLQLGLQDSDWNADVIGLAYGSSGEIPFATKSMTVSRYDLGKFHLVRNAIQQSNATVVHNFSNRSSIRLALANVRVPVIEQTEFVLGRGDKIATWRPSRLQLLKPDIHATTMGNVDVTSENQNLWPITVGTPILQDASESERQTFRKSLDVPERAKVMITTAPLIANSNLKDLIWACDLLKCIRNDVHLVIVGNGSQRVELERFTRCTEVQRHVHFLAPTSATVDWIRASDIYCASNSSLPHSMGTLTAMASGVPIVSVTGPFSDDLLVHQVTALGVEPGRRDQFARWAKYLLEQPRFREKLVSQARNWVAHQFPMTNLALSCINLYEHAANSFSHRAHSA
ncbi:MAG: glycosyltransferase [Pirellulaceae bacterium]